MNDLIYYQGWQEIVENLGGIVWEGGNKLPEVGLVFITLDHIDLFFRKILSSYYEKPLVLVSAASDNCVVDSKYSNSVKDLSRYFSMVPDMAACTENGRRDFIMRSRRASGRCLDSEDYTVRMYSWVSSTFPIIPRNVKRWFCVNVNIDDDRTIKIPFGVSKASVSELYNDNSKPEKDLFAAFGFNSNERFELYRYLQQTKLATCYQDLPFSRYVEEIRKHRGILCPSGNGLSCYRVSEVLALNRVPIIICGDGPTYWLQELDGIPHIAMSRFDYDFIMEKLPEEEEKLKEEGWREKIGMTYWKDRIQQEFESIK